MTFYDTNLPEYNKFRFVVPDVIDDENIVSITFVNVPLRLARYISAGYATAIDVNAWNGTVDARQSVVDKFSEVDIVYNICDIVANCIRDNPDVGQAIADAIASNADVRRSIAEYVGGDAISIFSGTASDPDAVASSSVVYEEEFMTGDCDKDVIFGQIEQIVELSNILIRDLYERFEVATTALERASTLASAIPLFGALPADEVLKFADDEFENLFEGYDGAYTAQLADEYKCDLFCLAVEKGCMLKLSDIAEYFRERSSATILDGLTVSEMASYFFTSTFGGSLISHASHYLLFAVLAFGARFINFDATYVARAIRSFANDPNSDWQTLCDPCTSSYCYTFDFASSASNSFTIVDGLGEFSSSGVTGTAGDDVVSVGAKILRAFGDRFNVTSVTVVYDCTSRSATDSFLRVVLDDVDMIDISIPSTGTDVTAAATGLNISGNDLSLYFDTGLTTGNVVIKSITIEGDSASPVGSSNC